MVGANFPAVRFFVFRFGLVSSCTQDARPFIEGPFVNFFAVLPGQKKAGSVGFQPTVFGILPNTLRSRAPGLVKEHWARCPMRPAGSRRSPDSLLIRSALQGFR